MSIRKSIQFYDTEAHYVVRRTKTVDGVETITENTYPKTEEGLEAAWTDYGPLLSSSKEEKSS